MSFNKRENASLEVIGTPDSLSFLSQGWHVVGIEQAAVGQRDGF